MIRELIKSLQTYANTSILKHYNVSSAQVSLAQVTEAQRLLDSLVAQTNKMISLEIFNKELILLYTIIPRKMRNVQANLIAEANTSEQIQQIQMLMANEQATLDVMRSQVELLQLKNKNTGVKKLNLLEILGLEITQIQTQDTIRLIKKMMDNESNRFVSAYKVTNKRTQKLFDTMLNHQQNKETNLFWHGSRNENWLSILETGLVLRPANAAISGKMFGYGLYFADRFRKSLNYTSIDGSVWARGKADKAYLSLFAVQTGNPYIIKNRDAWHGNLTYDLLQSKGQYDSVSALKGADLINNEYIIYRENQCTIQYLVEIKTN